MSVCPDFIARFCLCSRVGSGDDKKKKKNEWIYVKNLILLRQVVPVFERINLGKSYLSDLT